MLATAGTAWPGPRSVVVRGYPAIFPVNYALLQDTILICIRSGGDLARATVDSVAAFEIDGEDNVYHEGWSVLVVGRCAHLPQSVDTDRGVQAVGLLPWAGSDRDLFVRISIDEISGRRIGRRHEP